MLVIVTATILVYSNTLDASFHFDDFSSIVQNPALRDPRRLWPPGNRYLGELSFALNYRVGGLDVVGYHVVNLLIHACNALLVSRLASITLRTPALRRAASGVLVARHLPFAAGLLFAVHPLQTQAVTYVVQRFTSLATLFFLLSIILYAGARLSLMVEPLAKARVACLYGASVVFAVAAMKTKEISFTLPVVAAGYELLFFTDRRRLGVLLLAPLGATALLIPLGFARGAQSLGDALVTATGAEHLSSWTYLLTQSRVIVTYIRLVLLPVGQNLDHDFRLSHSIVEPSVFFALAVHAAIAALAVLLLRRARKTNQAPGVLAFFGIAWFFVTLSVESSFVPIRDVMFEHRVYLPSAGATIALATALLSALERFPSIAPGARAVAALFIVAAPLGAATYYRNLVWKDELTLWSDVVAKSPNKAPARVWLGNAYLAKGQLDAAAREYQEAIRLDPRSATPHVNLGSIFQIRGRLEDSAREYREAARLEPGAAHTHLGLGNVHQLMGRLDDALREYREAIRLDPSNADAHGGLGKICDLMGMLDEAASEYREALRLDPSMAPVHLNLGALLHTKGQIEEAMREYREAIRIDPSNAGAHVNLGAAYQAKGRLDDAIREYREAIRLDPTMREARLNLAAAQEAQDRLEEAARKPREDE